MKKSKITEELNGWEIGSEFHWTVVPKGPFIAWPGQNRMFASGRECLLSLWTFLQNSTINTLYVPDYFCAEVVAWWEQQGIVIRRYADAPHMTSPVWETLTVSQGDAVLAVNYFGIRDGRIWKEWRNANNGVLLIEDHSHDPLSGWAFDSEADYAFASLRKTFPVPDGAILWSPKNLPLPEEPQFGDWTGSALKLAAMILKKDYLNGRSDQVKATFRDFQIKGERMFGDNQMSAISPWSRFLLAPGNPTAWRKQRRENVHTLLDRISRSPVIQPLFTEWPDRNCPFNAILIFPSKEDRDKCRLRLIGAGVYPSVHWELSISAPTDVFTLSNRILTIPADQRYGAEDMQYVASILLNEQ